MITARIALTMLLAVALLAGCSDSTESAPAEPDSGTTADVPGVPDLSQVPDHAPAAELMADVPRAADGPADTATAPDTATVMDTGVDGGVVTVDGGGAVDGGASLVPADFRRLTVRAGSGDRSAVSPGSTCDGSHVDAYVIDVPTSTLSWDYCGFAADPAVFRVVQGQLHLSPTQLLGLSMAAAAIHPSDSPRCLDTGDYLTLDVDAPAGTGRFIDDVFSCPVSGEPRVLVAHVYEVIHEIGKLLPQPGKPDVFIAPDGFVRLTLFSTGGMPAPTDPTSTCNTSYVNTYTVDTELSSLAWNACRPVAPGSSKRAPSQGTCTLTRDQLTQVAVALAKIKLSAGNSCGLDKPTVTLDVQTSAGSAQYADDFYACHPNGRTLVSGIDDLTYLVPGLCPNMP